MTLETTSFGFTFGASHTQSSWGDARHVSWPDMVEVLTSHVPGAKEGSCLVPAIFTGSSRKKEEAAQIDVAFLDSDSGATLDDIVEALNETGWEAVVSSTHSHMTTHTVVSVVNWDRYFAKHPAAAPEEFLVDEKGYLPAVAIGAIVVKTDPTHVHLSHAPCPKFRVAVPLLKPWRAADYPSQAVANSAWKACIEALASALDLPHDQACTDTSRLFYLPRRPPNGAVPETAVVSGEYCDIFSLQKPVTPDLLTQATPAKTNGHHAPSAGRHEYADPITGEFIDLTTWARSYGRGFLIAKLLLARRPAAITGLIVDNTKVHIRCPNEGAHTHPGQDNATFVVNAGGGATEGFVIHCRHAHCTGQDRLFFVGRMLSERWIEIDDLTADEFQANVPAAPVVEIYSNTNWIDVPDPDSEDSYGQVSAKNNGAPVIEILPPEFADDALALNLSSHYGDTLRYVDAWARWFIWDGQVWRHDDTLKVYDLCRKTCRTYAINAPPNVQKAITSGKTIASVEKLIRADRRHAATVGQWDVDPWLLNTPSGIIDLRTRELLPHDPMHHMTKKTAVGPDFEADCPLWRKFLHEATNGDTDLQAYLQRSCGYALTGITREHAMFFAYGTGRNGKGVFLNTIVAIMGDYAMTADPDTFTASGSGKHLTVLARLQGARLVVAQETEEGVPWAEARIKSITGGDAITANYMRQDHFTYIPQFKLFMAGNHKPGLKSVDEAIKARFNLIPFLVTIAREQRDEQLTEKLIAERPAILRWMLDGCNDWQHVKLKPPKVVSQATGDYFDAEDATGLWIEDCCKTGSTWAVLSGDLFKSWTRWALAAGEQPGSQKRFAQTMASRGFGTTRSNGKRYFEGIGLPRPFPPTETAAERE